jgi:exopolysaccharide biosynthesis polyprenyl glycosylphosphotransferase
MLRRFSVNFALTSMCLDWFSVACGLWLAGWLRPRFNELPGIEPLAPSVVTPVALYYIFPVLWISIYAMLSIYDGRKFLRVADEFSALTLAMGIASVSAAGILYLSYREVSRFLFVLFILLVYILCLSWRVLARTYFRTQGLSPLALRRVLIVGAGPLGQKVRDQISSAETSHHLEFAGFVDDDLVAEAAGDGLLGDPAQIRKLVAEHSISDVLIALPHSKYSQLGEIIRRVDDLPVQVWVALGFFDLALYKMGLEDLAGIPVVDLRASAIDDYQRMTKRAFDIFLGLIALMLALPLIAIAALLILIEDGRPVIFSHKRVGENGRLFNMLKLRTMVRNAEQFQGQVQKFDADGNVIHKSKDDPRVTKVGRVLRRFSLDELPQFLNVVRGDMSLVGPRPELPYLVEKYQPWQRKRFVVPPGVTGWWQVNGRGDRPMHLNTEDDLYYIQNYSIFFDIQILLKTVWVVIVGKGSY